MPENIVLLENVIFPLLQKCSENPPRAERDLETFPSALRM